MKGSGFRVGALRLLSEGVLMMAIRKPRLVEVDFVFLVDARGYGNEDRVTIHVAKSNGKLSLSFAIGGLAEDNVVLPAALVGAIQAGLEYAAKHVRVQDLSELEPDPDADGEGDR